MYSLKELPYAYDALEPYIDTHTLGLHKNMHQKKYLSDLNQILEQNGFSKNIPIESLYQYVSQIDPKDQENFLFSLGGVLNHDYYFLSMSPMRELPSASFQKEINFSFGSLEKMKEEMMALALSLKGAGYTYLVWNQDHLELLNFKNQDCPIFYGFIPILSLDMWEHAYYLNCENRKKDYISYYFEVLDFSLGNQFFHLFDF